jgi:hypothetical protein
MFYEKYFPVFCVNKSSTVFVGRFIYTKYWEIDYVEHGWKIYLHKILGNTLG